MTGEKETKVEQSTGATEQEAGTPPPEVQEKVYTQKDIDAILSEKDKAYKGLQKTLSKKDRELETLKAQSQSGGATTHLKTLTEEVERVARESGGVDTSRLIALRQELEAEERRVAAMSIIETERQKLAKEISEKGEDPEDEKFDDVWRDFDFSSMVTGDWNKPRKTLEKTLAKSKPKEAQENEDEKVNRLAEEKARKMLEEKGLLVSDVNLPSGVSAKREEIIAKYARGEMSRADYEKAMKSK
jgi:hypothetical protein